MTIPEWGVAKEMGSLTWHETASAVQSPTGMNYSSMHQSNTQTRNSRLRAASATLPLGLDIRSQYRGSPNGPTAPRSATTSSQYSSAYTASFPSAPLSAPVDFSLSRGSGALRAGVQDYSMPQMSAPIAPSNDFSQAFQASLASPTARTPMRDSFGGGGLGIGGGQGEQREGFGENIGGSALGKKRSFNGVPTSGAAPQGVYGNTT